MTDNYIKICPECGSTELNFDSLSLGRTALANGSISEYCRNCNYGKNTYNAFFPEIKKMKSKNSKKILK